MGNSIFKILTCSILIIAFTGCGENRKIIETPITIKDETTIKINKNVLKECPEHTSIFSIEESTNKESICSAEISTCEDKDIYSLEKKNIPVNIKKDAAACMNSDSSIELVIKQTNKLELSSK